MNKKHSTIATSSCLFARAAADAVTTEGQASSRRLASMSPRI